MLKKFSFWLVIALSLTALTIVSGISLSSTLSADTAHQKGGFAAYYQEYLDKHPFAYYGYRYIYLDDDTVPELLLEGGCEANGYLLLSKQGDSVVSLLTNRLSFKYIERKGMCGYQSGNMGDYLSEFFRLEGGRFVKYISRRYEDIDIPRKVRDEVYRGFFSKGHVIDVTDGRNQIFYTYKIKDGEYRYFCDFTPTEHYASPDCHYVGVAGDNAYDTIALVRSDEGKFLQSPASAPSIYKRIADDGRSVYIAISDTKSYTLYKLDCKSLKVKCLASQNVRAIRATESGFIITESRVSNQETARNDADYEYVFHDITIDNEGRILSNDSTQEYGHTELSRRYNSGESFPIVGFFD